MSDYRRPTDGELFQDYRPDSLNDYADLILEQARALYRYRPDVESRLFVEI